MHISHERLEIRGDAAELTVVGELDAFTGPTLSSALSDLLAGPDGGDLTLDLSGVTFVDSSALRILMLTRKQVTDSGHAFALRSPSGPVTRLLEVSGLVDHFDVV